MYWVLIGFGIATALFLTAIEDNIQFYKSPSEVVIGDYPKARSFRLGGMVKKGSIVKSTTSLDVNFIVTDYAEDVKVHYTGLLPDLFRDDQGMIATGKMDDAGVFSCRRNFGQT